MQILLQLLTFMALGLGWPAPLNWCATKKAIFSLVLPGLMTYQVSNSTRPSSIWDPEEGGEGGAEEGGGAWLCVRGLETSSGSGGVFSEPKSSSSPFSSCTPTIILPSSLPSTVLLASGEGSALQREGDPVPPPPPPLPPEPGLLALFWE